MTPAKIKALLVMDRSSFRNPQIELDEHEVTWSRGIWYLGEELDRWLDFGKHFQIATNKAIQCGDNLARLMPTIGGKRGALEAVLCSSGLGKCP